MTNYADSDDVLIDQEKVKKVTEVKHTSKILQKEKSMPGSEQCGAALEKKTTTNKEILQDGQLSISLKKQVMDQCVLPTVTYGCQTWSLSKLLTNKELLKEQQRGKC